MTTLQEVLHRIEARTGTKAVRRSDYWMCQCPAHDDSNPSLSVKEGERVPFVLKCHAGCDFASILSAIGLEMQEDWRANADTRPQSVIIEERQEEEARERSELMARRRALQDENGWLRATSLVQENAGLMQVWSDELFGCWMPIVEKIVPYYSLGYLPEKRTYKDGELVTTEALTIPYWGPPGDTLLTIQYKMLGKEFAKDKYRFHYGIGASLFLTRPDKKFSGHALVVEGAKKAIVTYVYVGNHFDHVIGLPSKTPSTRLVKLLNSFDRVTLALDPDAHFNNGDMSALERIMELLRTDVFYMSLPSKPDDFFTKLSQEASLFMTLARNARRGNSKGVGDGK